MPPQMNVAMVEQFGEPLVLREWNIPTPNARQIVVKTEACGVCHTDLHAAQGDWPVKPTLPFIPGHETIGLIAAVGSGETIVKEGDRVGVPWLYSVWSLRILLDRSGRRCALRRSSEATPLTVVLPSTSLPIRTMLRMCLPV